MKKISPITILMLFFFLPGIAQSKLSPDEAIAKLKAGNERYVAGERTYPHQDKTRRDKTSKHGQHPYATIIGCSDSRVPVEHIFDAGIGDLFIIRVAGNVVDTDEAGSIEYGVHHLHTPVFVVLGHSSCGAVTAVTKNADVHGNIPPLVDNIQPAVEKAKKEHGSAFSDELLNAAITNNVWQAIEDLYEISPVSAELIKENKLKVIGAVYHVDTGKVEWLGQHPKEKALLAKSKSH